jgi:hypothetical protein
MSDRPRFQYSLRSLLWLTTGLAVLCSVLATCPADWRWLLIGAIIQSVLLALVIVITYVVVVIVFDVVAWFQRPQLGANSLAAKVSLLIRSAWFWFAGGIALFAVFGLNLRRYFPSHVVYEEPSGPFIGWPFLFHVYRSIGSYDFWSGLPICADMLVAMALALFAGIGFRRGIHPILANAKRLFHKIRNWPNEVETPKQDLPDRQTDQ